MFPDKLKGFIQKWLTAGVAIKQVKCNCICSDKGLLVGNINQCS